MTNQKKLILASASEERLRLLNACGYFPDLILPADIDESELKNESPKALSIRLALGKAKKIAEQFPNDVILAADTVVAVGKTSLPKALSIADAEFCIDKLSGKRHRVYTGVCVAHQGVVKTKIGLSIVKFKRITIDEKRFYINSMEWRGKAGGYALRGSVALFVQWISGLDTNIMGLPMQLVYNMLGSFGVSPVVSNTKS